MISGNNFKQSNKRSRYQVLDKIDMRFEEIAATHCHVLQTPIYGIFWGEDFGRVNRGNR